MIRVMIKNIFTTVIESFRKPILSQIGLYIYTVNVNNKIYNLYFKIINHFGNCLKRSDILNKYLQATICAKCLLITRDINVVNNLQE